MSNHDQELLNRLQMLLPFYTNGTLNEEDSNFVEDFLKQHPETQTQLQFERNLILAMRDPVPERTIDAGLTELMKRWHQTPKQKSFIDSLKEVFHDWGLTPAFAIAAVIVVVQSAMLINIQQQSTSEMIFGEKFRSMNGTEVSKQFFKLSISANVEYAQVIQLIKDQGCRIQDGPTQSGALIIACPQGERIQQQLQSSPLVDDVISEQSE